MAQRVTECRPFLSIRGELRPIARDRRFIVQHAPIGEHVNSRRDDPLRRGIDREESVPIDQTTGLFICDASPEIKREFAIDVGHDLDTKFSPIRDHAIEKVLNLPTCFNHANTLIFFLCGRDHTSRG